MKVVMRTHRIVSTEQADAALEELARACNVDGPCYDESAAGSMSEFDAMKWTTLCSQRSALQEREYDLRLREWAVVPPQFLGIYETKDYSKPVRLENTDESLSLAA
jgi:hypothetical protein